MGGDTVCAGSDCNFRRPHGIRMLATARIAHCRNVIDVDTEAEVRGWHLAEQPKRREGLFNPILNF